MKHRPGGFPTKWRVQSNLPTEPHEVYVAERIRAAGTGQAHGLGQCILFLVGMQGQDAVQGAHQHVIDLPRYGRNCVSPNDVYSAKTVYLSIFRGPRLSGLRPLHVIGEQHFGLIVINP